MGLLFVCTGNICRSAVAEHLATRWLGSAVTVGSAGTSATTGRRMHPFSEAALQTFGVRGTGFRSRRLDADMIECAELVLTMTIEHRDLVLRMAPRHLRRVFALREAAVLCEAVDPAALVPLAAGERLGALAALIGDARATRVRRRHAPDVDDVLDPITGPPETHLGAAREVAANVRRITDTLSGRSPETTVLMTRRPPVPQAAEQSWRSGRSAVPAIS